MAGLASFASKGPTRFLFFTPTRAYNFGAVLLSDDGVTLRAETGLLAELAGRYLLRADLDGTLAGVSNFGSQKVLIYTPSVLAKSGSEQRALLRWASSWKGVVWPDGTVLLRKTFEGPSILTATVAKADVKRCAELASGVRYDGWTKSLGISLDKLHKIVSSAVAACKATWGWAAEGLTVVFHTTGKAAGLAYAPGAKDRRISLHKMLFTGYTDNAVWRVIVHELCHHAREELHPRSSRVHHDQPHDSVFCSMLKAADPGVSNQSNCEFFTEKVDVAALNDAKARGGVRFEASEGVLVVVAARGSGVRWTWEPRRKGAWKPPPLEVFNNDRVLPFLREFPREVRSQIDVEMRRSARDPAPLRMRLPELGRRILWATTAARDAFARAAAGGD